MPAPLRASAHASWTVRRPLPPIEGESLDGFIARVAAHTLVDNALAISSLGGVAYGHRPDLSTHGWEGLPAVAECLQVDIADLQQRSYPLIDPARDLRLFFGTPLERRHFEVRTRRFSPAGLRLSNHHRALWQLRIFPFCIETWEYLLDRCPRCHAPQRWYRTNGIERCDYCVEDLRRAPSELVPPEHREAALAAVGLAHPDQERRSASLKRLPDALQSLGSGPTLELLILLLPLFDRAMPGTRAGKRRTWDAPPSRITAAVAKAWPVLEAWPGAALDLLAANIAVAPSRYSDGAHGMSIYFLNTAGAYAHPAVKEAIASLRAEVDLDGPRGDTIRATTLGIKSVSKLLGHGTHQLTRIRRLGGLPTIFTLKGSRAVARFDTTKVAEIRRVIDVRLSFERAAWLLGISYHGVEQLAAMRLLPTITHPYFPLRYGCPQTTLPGLQMLQQRIEARAAKTVPDPIRLRSAVAVIGGRLKPWAPIFQALLDGAMPYSLNETGERLTQRIEIGRSSLATLAQIHFERQRYPNIPFAESMTRHDAGEVLNLQPKEYTPLLKSYESGDHASDRIVPVAEIERLAQELIGSAEVALRLGISARSAFYRLQKLGIDTLHSFLWRRASIEELLFNETSDFASNQRCSLGLAVQQPQPQ